MKRIPVLAAVVLAAATLAPTAATAAAPVSPTQHATDWIAGELTNGLAVGSFGPDIGLSIDAGLAFDSLGRSADADVVRDAIADQLVTSAEVPYGYVRSDEGGTEGRYANATAKAAAFTERIGDDADTQYLAIDLVAQLEDLTDDATGVIADSSSFGDYANTLGQSFAVEALTAGGSSEAEPATAALLAQQCPSGYFRLELSANPCAADSAGPAPDTTAVAVLSLVESGVTDAAVTTAINRATAWLESVQLDDGSFAGDAAAPGSNSNSTGLAGWALGKAGRQTSAAQAAAWTRSMQVADAGACVSQAPTGAIAYNAADLDDGRIGGITDNATVRDKWRRAAFQSAPVLRWAPAATVPLSISSPATAVEKSSVTTTVRGVAAGEQACVSFGSDARRVVGTASDLSVSFTLPAGGAVHTFTVATLAGNTTSSTAATLVPAPTTATPAPTPTDPVVGNLKTGKVEKVKNNGFKLAISCDSEVACNGKLKVRSVGKVTLANGQTRTLLVAKSTYSVKPGRTATIKLTIAKPARKVLGSKRLRVKAVQTARGAESTSTKFWLRRQ